MATPAYFFPKTVEIIFQQLLVLAMIVSLSIDGLPLRTISASPRSFSAACIFFWPSRASRPAR